MDMALDKEKEIIIGELKKNGCRITKQRKIILDIILENDCSSSKEIYYRAVKKDSAIGMATVYRMVRMLEEIGVISQQNSFRVMGVRQEEDKDGCRVILNDNREIFLKYREFCEALERGLRLRGLIEDESIKHIVVASDAQAG